MKMRLLTTTGLAVLMMATPAFGKQKRPPAKAKKPSITFERVNPIGRPHLECMIVCLQHSGTTEICEQYCRLRRVHIAHTPIPKLDRE
jgi:hypothetical protein